MREPIRMPALSDTMAAGRLQRWLKQPGDRVRRGEPIAEIETDKALMELEAMGEGWLAGPLAEPGRDYPVGAVIAYLAAAPEEQDEAAGGPGGKEGAPSPEREETREEHDERSGRGEAALPPPERPPRPRPAPVPGRPPRGEAPAPSAGVEPAGETEAGLEAGTGTERRAEKGGVPAPDGGQSTPVSGAPEDSHPAPEEAPGAAPPSSPYARALARELGLDLSRVRPGPDGVIRAPQVAAALLRGPGPNLDSGPPWHLEHATPMRRAVAENMSAAAATPAFRVSAEAELGALARAAKAGGHSLTVVLARACALTVREHPRFNWVWTGEDFAARERIDVGIAVDVARGGLVTPVLRDVAGRPLDALGREWIELRDRARQGRLRPREYEGATFYLTNLGMFPAVARFDAIVPVGAAAILAVGAARKGRAEVTLCCDHRVVYGADAARWLETLLALVAAPEVVLEERPEGGLAPTSDAAPTDSGTDTHTQRQ